jgi:DNA-binding protein Alba
MNYVLAVITLFGSGDTKEITLKARGQAITTAVDVAEITRRRFMESLKVEKVNIDTEEITMEEGGTRAVSTMEIILSKSS